MIISNVVTMAAGEVREMACGGNYFELRTAAGSVSLIELLDRSGGIVSLLTDAEQTDYVRTSRNFEQLRITNGATAQTIKFYYGEGDSGSNRFTGNVTGTVTVSNQPATSGAITQAAFNVTNVSTNMLAARANRRYLLVQNNDTTGIVYINLAGGVAAEATGIKIIAGASIEIQGYVTSSVIRAIGSIASNANVTVVEG